jgi:hypothetical protein
MIIVTKAASIASFNGHVIYEISDTSILPITYKTRHTLDETKYKQILYNIDFHNGFYFSYSYDLTNSLQNNMTYRYMDSMNKYSYLQDYFIWNYYALNPFFMLISNDFHSFHDGDDHDSNKLDDLRSYLYPWIVPIIHGYVYQNSILLSNENYKLCFTLIARRSRHFAGTSNSD